MVSGKEINKGDDMSPEEHYFENLLYAFASGGMEAYHKQEEIDSNTQYFSKETEQAIKICADYFLDCCDWLPHNTKCILEGNYRVPEE